MLLTTRLVAMVLAVTPASAQSSSANKGGSASEGSSGSKRGSANGDSAAPVQHNSSLPPMGGISPMMLVSVAVLIMGTAVSIVALRWRSD